MKAHEALMFNKIMEDKGITIYDLQLSTGLPINVISRIINLGEGTIDDINKIIGCLNVKIEDCINEELMLVISKPKKTILVTDIFKQKSILHFLHPESIKLTKSFQDEVAVRYTLKGKLIDDKSENLYQNAPVETVERLKERKEIYTYPHRTIEEAKKEYKEMLSRLGNLAASYPSVDEAEVIEVEYGTLELLLEYYDINFNPFESNKLLRINRVYPKGEIKIYNEEYLKKVYAICSKPKPNIMRSRIYTNKDIEDGTIFEHIKLMNLFDITSKHQGCEIVEFLVPKNFDTDSYLIETNSVFNEIERLKFTFKEIESK